MTTKTKTKKNGSSELVTVESSPVDARKVSRLEKNALERVEVAQSLKVTNTVSYQAAADFALTIKEVENSVHELYDEHIEKAYSLHKGLTSARKRLLDPLANARQIAQQKMSGYDAEQRRLAYEKAEKEAEEERQRQLKAAQKRKDKEAVAELKEAPLDVVVDVPTPKVQGVVTKEVFTFEITDPSKVPDKYWVIDEKAIAAAVKTMGELCEIPGVKVIKTIQTQIRG